MSAHLTSTSPENAVGHHAADDVTEYYTRVLHELIDVGVELIHTLPAQAKAQAHAQPGVAPTAPDRDDPIHDAAPATTDVGLAYDRITRAVRRTILLARKLAEPAPAADTTAAKAASRHRVGARRQIIREVEDAIGRAEKGTRAETLNAELIDRLDGPDLDEDIEHRPTADIVADICRDLGLAAVYGTNPWRRRTPTQIETLCARAAQPPAEPFTARPREPARLPASPKLPRNTAGPRTTPPATVRSNPAAATPLDVEPDEERAPVDDTLPRPGWHRATVPRD